MSIVMYSGIPGHGMSLQSARMSGKSLLLDSATVCRQVRTNPDSLIPSRIAALMTTYVSQNMIPMNTIRIKSSIAACRCISICNCSQFTFMVPPFAKRAVLAQGAA